MFRSDKMRAMKVVTAAGLIVAGAFVAQTAMAAGALVVGVTGNPRDGVASGWAINYESEDRAKKFATEKCRHFKRAPKAAKFCRLVGTFTTAAWRWRSIRRATRRAWAS